MYKNILSTGILIGCLSLSNLASAEYPKYGMAGCGLGSLAFGESHACSAQTSAGTTNQSTFNQGFGITSGTSNCVESGKAAAYNAQQQFMVDNYSTLSKELAQGDGETLRAFSQTFGCTDESYPAFATHMKKSYEKIFSAPGSMAALSVVNNEIKNDQKLSTTCALAI